MLYSSGSPFSLNLEHYSDLERCNFVFFLPCTFPTSLMLSDGTQAIAHGAVFKVKTHLFFELGSVV